MFKKVKQVISILQVEELYKSYKIDNADLSFC